MNIDPQKTLKIENVVASAKVNDSIDLVALAAQLPGADYDKKRFPGVVIRIEKPKIAALVFGSGKVVLTGAKSLDSLETGLKYLLNLLKKYGIKIEGKPKCSVQNIVTSADLGSRINLNKIAMGLTLDKIEYEPEQFPGLVYRLEDPKVVVLLFGSGKVIITGGKKSEDAGRAVEKICADLQELKILQ
ncbi:MAG TPA: TATA-box-binding protein [Methanocorpusculum sp.]|nr:TATA-box-binding protein [Methanocorpusculum sp.]